MRLRVLSWPLVLVALVCTTLAAPRRSPAPPRSWDRHRYNEIRRVLRGHHHDEKDAGTNRHKRWILAAASFAVGLANAYLNGRIRSVGATPEMTDEIRHDLRETSGALDGEFREVLSVLDSLRQGAQTHSSQGRLLSRVAGIFENDADRLTYFKQFTDDDNNFDEDNEVMVSEGSLAWSEAVLSENSDGIRAVLDNIHRMIMGVNETRPIIEVYMNALRLSGYKNIVQQTEKLVETLNNMQNVGYALWSIALDIAGRSDEKVTTVLTLIAQRTALEEEFLSVEEHYKSWPQGSYGLVKSAQGCPEGHWDTGSRYHDTEDNMNSWTPTDLDKYISGSFQDNGIKWEFCMNANTESPVTEWPSGKYCIFAGSGQCPAGFDQGWLFFDDENNSNGNTVSGSRPHGDYGVDTRYDFCCRNDGDENTEISLPLENPFVLFPFDQYSCQKVKWMTATELNLSWDCEDDDNENDRQLPYPQEDDQGEDMSITMCYYD